MRRFGAIIVPWAVLAALGLACFARLFADPSGLVVDGHRPSIDFANRGEPRPLGNDVTFLFLPHHLYVAKRLAEFGHPPTWDSSGFSGRPMIGNPQSGLFYPPVWLAWISPYPASLGWLTVAHLLWGGLGLYVLARGEGLSRWAATVAAGVFQASPYLLAQTFEGHYPHVWAASWFPWAFRALAELRQGRAVGVLALPPILTCCYLAGHPQEWFLLVITMSIWVGWDAMGSVMPGERAPLSAGARLASWAAVLAISLGMAAFELVPEYKVLPWVQKGPQAEAGAFIPRNYQVNLVSGFQLLAPGALGGPADYFGVDNYWESVLSVGLTPLILLGVAVVASRQRRRTRGWVVLVALSVWFATGRQLSLFGLLNWLLPGMSWFRVPARSLFLASLGAAMLAAHGYEALEDRLTDPKRWRRFAARLGRIAVMLIGFLLVMKNLGGVNSVASRTDDPVTPDHLVVASAGVNSMSSMFLAPSKNLWRAGRAAERILHDSPFWITVAAMGSAIGLGSLGKCWKAREGGVKLIGLLCLCELAWHGFALIQVAPAAKFLNSDPICEAILLMHPNQPGGVPTRVRARDAFFLDLEAVRYGIEKTNLNDAFQLAHAAALYETLYPVATRMLSSPETPMSIAVDDDRRRIRQAVFDRSGVSYLVSDRVEADPAWPVAFTGGFHDKTFVIQQNPTALPRAYVVPRAEVVEDDDSTTALSQFRSSDPRASVLMNHDPLAGLPTDRRQSFTPARWLSQDPDRPVLEVATEAPGLLVVAETWMPGWSARVDGEPASILRGNHAHRVIPLKHPGRHSILLRYRPPGLATGCVISACAVLVWITLCALLTGLRGRSHWDWR
jgi:hypothetical protein